MTKKLAYEKWSDPLRSLIVWLLGALFMFYKYAIEVSPSVMTTTLMKSFQINAIELGNLTACYFYAYLLLQIPAGILLDKLGPRKITTLAIGLCGVGTLIFSWTDSFFIACIGRFLNGTGAAFAAINSLKLIANWFPSRYFALMSGLMMTVGMLGAVGGQAPLASFIQKMEWRQAMEWIGVAGLAFAALFWLIVRDNPPGRIVSESILFPKVSLAQRVRAILKNGQSWWLSIYSGLAFAPVLVFGGLWGVSFINQAFHLGQQVSAQTVSLIFIGFALGAPIFGWFSDWLGRRRVVMFWGTIAAFFTLSAAIYTPNIPLSLLSVLLFTFGFSISSFLLCFTMISEITLPILVATGIGFMNAFDALFGAFSDPLTGYLLDLGWAGKIVDGARIFPVGAYQTAFLTLPAYLILSLIALFKVKETFCQKINVATVESGKELAG